MAPKSAAHATCILYDPADGSILLTHTVVRFDAARAADRKAVESEAREILTRGKRVRLAAKALHVDADTLKPGAAYRVAGGKLKLRK